MKHLLIPLLVLLPFPNVVNSSHLNNQRELIVTSESTKDSIELAKYLKDKDIRILLDKIVRKYGGKVVNK